MAEQQADHSQASSTVLEVPVPADVYERLEALAESHRDTRTLALDMVVTQLAQRDEHAEHRRTYLSRIREANAETPERLAEVKDAAWSGPGGRGRRGGRP
jgi:hypothetical protein